VHDIAQIVKFALKKFFLLISWCVYWLISW